MKELKIDEIKEVLKTQGPNTKVYMGCDSYRYKAGGKWYAKYTTVLVIHKNGNNGCSVFGKIDVEPDYDKNKKRPSMRLMNEVYRVSQLYIDLGEVLEDFDVEVHIDINPNEMYGSSCVITQAIGYVRGVCNVDPVVKPNSWCASHAADRFRAYS